MEPRAESAAVPSGERRVLGRLAAYARAPGAAPLAAALAACAAALPRVTSPVFCLDDAYIHLSYVRSLQLGEGLSYNPGDFATGVTSPLWVLLLAISPSTSPLAVKLFGTALHAISAALVSAVAVETGARDSARAQWAAGLLWALSPLAVQGATSGMEVPLAAALALATTWLALTARYRLAACAAALAYLARPELAVYACALALGLCAVRRSRAPLWLAAGSVGAAAAFGAYCVLVSGYPLPNTFYVKGEVLPLQGLRYLALEVLAREPVVLSLLGVLALLAPLRQARAYGPANAVFAAACATLLAVGASRTLYPGVAFFQSRYFVPVLWALPLLASIGLTRLPRVLAALAVPALALATGLALVQGAPLQRAQERGVRTLHLDPARYIAAHLPAARVLGVEGAGALRYLTPRSLRVMDLLGLNDNELAHMKGNFFRRLCYLRQLGVTHVAYPAQWRADMQRAFELVTLKRFTERAYAQVDPPVAWQLTLAEVRSARPEFARYCATVPH
jgi:hypothetical protein